MISWHRDKANVIKVIIIPTDKVKLKLTLLETTKWQQTENTKLEITNMI